MRALVGRRLPRLIAASVAALVLAGYFLPSVEVLTMARSMLLEWGVIVAGFALLVGLINVVRVHGRRIVDQEAGWPYSAILLVATLAAWVPGVLPIERVRDAAFAYVLRPLGAAFAALLLFALVYAACHIARVRRGLDPAVFLLVAGLVLLGSTPLAGGGWFAGVRDWLLRIPSAAGVRGLLLGVGLGTLVTGLRVILGRERLYTDTSLNAGDHGRESPGPGGEPTGQPDD